jgi:glycosyltransferase involved in cell wall biosynthesis
MLNGARSLPGMSVVVTASNKTTHLRRCLEHFSDIWAECRAQVIVVHAGALDELPALAEQFPPITWITADPSARDSDLRRIGSEQVSRDVVLFLEDRDTERFESVATLCRNWRVWSETGGRVISAPICRSEQTIRYPYLSVVMPVRNGGAEFLLALQALALSDIPRQAWELVIVDDNSTDETAVVAAQYADKLLRLRSRARGPGYARNRGFELTLGECVAFINADVMVETDTLRTAVTLLTQHADLGAIFGLCGSSPMTTHFLSEYRSLVQRYYHEANTEDTRTFSSACGFVRSSVFERAGGYDEWHFSRRQLEDLELGQRIRSLGEGILPHADIRATHLRRWTLRRMIATEIFDRAVPWMRLVKRELLRADDGSQPRRRSKNLKMAISWLAVLSAALAWSGHSMPMAIAATACVAVVLVSIGSQLAFFARERGVGFALLTVPFDFLYYLVAGLGVAIGWIAREAFGDPTPGAEAEAFAEMGRKRWPPVPVKRIARPSSIVETEVRKASTLMPAASLLPQEPTSGEPPADASNVVQ